MGKALVVVESPTKARTIGRFLARDLQVLASMGHVRDLPEASLSVDVAGGFQPVYVLTANGRRMAGPLRRAAHDAGDIYLATDPDREGEAIAWHLVEMLKDAAPSGRFHRVTFHEITRAAIEAAFRHPGAISDRLVAAQQARRVLDRLVGYLVSPLLWRDVRKGTSAGRVQSVALRLVCEREREIQAFKPVEFWNLHALFETIDSKAQLKTTLALLDGAKPVVADGATAEALAREIEGAAFAVAAVTSKPRRQGPPPPFITSTLQQAAGGALRFSTTQTMQTAQQLYEGIDLGEGGPVGLITYMRTDSVAVSQEAQNQAREFIATAYGKDYVPASPNRFRSRQSAQEAHEAIRPTDVQRTPEALAPFLNSSQLRLYRLIWNRFVASQMEAARMLDHAVDIEARGQHLTHAYIFRATARETLFPGYLVVYSVKESDQDDEDNQITGRLPDLSVDTLCRLLNLDREQCFTQPPRRYSEATLVKALEQNGVGRPSTYSATVNTIQERKYVRKEKGLLIPGDLGFSVNDYLVGRMPALFDIGFTAEMESELDQIEEGTLDGVRMLTRFYEQFRTWVRLEETPPVPAAAGAADFLRAFPADLAWEAPARRGRRVFDDREFRDSLLRQVTAEGKPLSERQWKALLALAARYSGRCPALLETAERLGVRTAVAALAAAQEARAAAPPVQPDEEDQRLVALLERVTWEAPAKRGRRVFDDARFYNSLRRHVAEGRHLTPAQKQALHRLAVKYSAQVPDFAAAAASLGISAAPADTLPAPGTASAEQPALKPLVDMLQHVRDWDPPVSRGRRSFDDKEFAESLSRQFARKGTLSDRQQAALRKLLARYSAQIPDYAAQAQALGLLAPAVPAAPVNASCPECGAPLLRRTNRRRGTTFFGCSAFPKCRFLCSELPPPAAGASGPAAAVPVPPPAPATPA
jgi:DNA topoisomerase-1